MSSDDLERKSSTEGNAPALAPSGLNEKHAGHTVDISSAALPEDFEDDPAKDAENADHAIIKTGQDASLYLLPIRDDRDPVLTFRSILLATGLSCFQAVMSQIYMFKPTSVSVSGTFVVLIAYFAGNAWAKFLPRGDHLEARWRETTGGTGSLPLWIKFVTFLNPRPWGLKEHAIASITATAASQAAVIIQVFTAQDLFYDMPLSGVTVVLAVVSVALFGYGICGIMRPIAVWHVDAVYWSTLPTVKSLQALHWQDIQSNKPIRYFWYAFGSMFAYEWFPAYIFPWLNAVSIPCLAAMKTTGTTAQTLTNIFGGSVNNEGLGLFSLAFDWQYITSFQTSLPLSLQLHQAAGFIVCFAAMLGIYYTDTWGAKSLPFMSTALKQANGTTYPSVTVFPGGVLDEAAFETYGIPRLTGTFAYGLLIANAAIGALVAHCFLFWGNDFVEAFKNARKNVYTDRHHAHMAKNYKDVPQWWYMVVLVGSFVLGLIVVTTQNITLPVWAYVVALALGIFIAPLSTILYSRFGNGIATNNLSKMIAGLAIPNKPVGNMYFAAWSHNVISCAVNLSNDLKLGEYLKIPPRVMFLTQCYGTILGGFVNYAVMINIVNGNRELLVSGNGDSSWSGAQIQAFNTNAASWALSKYLYRAGETYFMVPLGLVIGAAIVALHRIFVHFVPKIRGISTRELNMPQFIQYSGFLPINQSQTCVLLSWCLAGFFCQFWLRNYRPRIFKDYMYLVTAAWDGASLTVMFILSFAVFGAGGPSKPFPTWWGNNADGYYDLCPVAD